MGKVPNRSNGEPDKLPPHCLDTEKAVLGIILNNDSNFDIARKRVRNSEAFYDLVHRTIWKGMNQLRLLHRKVEPISLISLFNGEASSAGAVSVAFLSELANTAPPADVMNQLIDVLIERWTLRRMVRVMTEATARIMDGNNFEGVMDGIQRDMAICLRESMEKSASPLKAFAEVAAQELERDFMSESTASGIPTGFKDYDYLTGGLHPGELVVFAARPAVGKTALVMNIAENCGVPVGVMSLEMTGIALAKRVISSFSSVNIRDAFSKIKVEENIGKITDAMPQVYKCPIYIDDSSNLTVGQIISRARLMHSTWKIEVLIVDYLQIVHGDERVEKRYLEISEITKRLKGLAKDLNICVIIASQLSRKVQDASPTLSDLAESGAIEQDADTVCLLSVPDKKKPSTVKAFVAKQRNGPTGDFNFTFMNQYTRFENAARIEDEDLPLPYQD